MGKPSGCSPLAPTTTGGGQLDDRSPACSCASAVWATSRRDTAERDVAVGSGSDRLERDRDRVAARRQPGQHPPRGDAAQNLGVGEQLIRRHWELTRTVARAHPRPRHRDPAPAQGHRPRPAAVADRGPFRVVAAARPAHRGHVLLHDRGHHLQPSPDREGQQTLPQLSGQLTHSHAHLPGHGGLTRVDLVALVVLARGGPLSSWCSWRFTRFVWGEIGLILAAAPKR